MKIKNAMCSLSELTSEQIDILRNAMPRGQYDFFKTENTIGVTPKGKWGTWDARGIDRNIVTYTEMMQLLGKTMKEFTKSDLKTGMFVKQRDGDYAIVLDETLSTMRMYTELRNIASSLYHNSIKSSDIMAVYTTASRDTLECHLDGESLALIWERTEQTPAQKEMEVLQVKMNESQAKMNELQAQMKVVQAKL
jgi:hypothetical protein